MKGKDSNSLGIFYDLERKKNIFSRDVNVGCKVGMKKEMDDWKNNGKELLKKRRKEKEN